MNESSETVAPPGNRITLRVRLRNQPSVLAGLIRRIADRGGNLGAIDIVRPGPASA